jgi:hypothetical protein
MTKKIIDSLSVMELEEKIAPLFVTTITGILPGETNSLLLHGVNENTNSMLNLTSQQTEQLKSLSNLGLNINLSDFGIHDTSFHEGGFISSSHIKPNNFMAMSINDSYTINLANNYAPEVTNVSFGGSYNGYSIFDGAINYSNGYITSSSLNVTSATHGGFSPISDLYANIIAATPEGAGKDMLVDKLMELSPSNMGYVDVQADYNSLDIDLRLNDEYMGDVKNTILYDETFGPTSVGDNVFITHFAGRYAP